MIAPRVVAATAVILLLVAAAPAAAGPPFAVGLRIVRLVDPTRTIRLPDGRREPRTLITYVRYPALGRSSANDLDGAPAARAAGPFPLVVFGHGYAVTPAPYAHLLRAWARAGYVVAAPVFPLGNARAPGRPDESDLVNQPADLSLVITRMLAPGAGPLSGLVDPARIAVAGHSDGGETALAVAYDRRFVDTRVRAALILAGAEIPGGSALSFPHGSPPLLAIQGSADRVNPPSFTDAFYRVASRPKFLLTLPGAGHLPPYTAEEPQLGIVERVTTAFLDRYLKDGSLGRLVAAAAAPGLALLESKP